MSDEVELSDPDSDEYEVIPLDPIRKLERRMNEMEEKSNLSREEGLIRDVVDIMKTNQQMVNNMVDSTNSLKNNVEDLTHKMDNVVNNMNEFMELLEEASEASLEQDINQNIEGSLVDPLTNKMQEIVDTNRKMLEGLSSLGDNVSDLDKRLKQSANQSSQRRRPTRRRQRSGGSRSGGNRGSGNRSTNNRGQQQ